MASAETVVLTFAADLSDLKADLATLPGITEKEAREMVRGLEKQLRKAEKASKKAAKTSKKAWGASKTATDQAATSVKQFGEDAGETESILLGMAGAVDLVNPALGDMMRRMGDLSGASEAGARSVKLLGVNAAGLGATAGPLAIGLAAVATAVALVGNATHEATEDHRRLTEVLESQTSATDRLTMSNNLLKASTGDVEGFIGSLQMQTALATGEIDKLDLAAGKLGGDLADTLNPQLLAAGKAVAENRADMEKLDAIVRDTSASFKDQAEASKRLDEARAAQTGLEKNLGDLKALRDQGSDAINDYVRGLRDTDAALESNKRALESKKNADEAAREAAQEHARILAEQEAALEQLNETIQRHVMSQLDDRGKILETYDREIAQIDELASKYVENEEIQAAAALARAEAAETMNAELFAIEQEALTKQHALRVSMAEDTAASLMALGELVNSARMRQLTTGDVQEQLMAQKLFKRAQAMAIVQAVMDTAVAVMKAATIAPFPANVPSMVGAGLQGATQVAMIKSQKPPSFPTGGVIPIDHQLISAAPGEAVLNRRAVDSLGVDGVDALNTGRTAQPVVITVPTYEHRVFNAFVADSIAVGGPLRSALNNRGNNTGHSRRGRR
tara:strand:+ start:3261 stop:5129 length:1869 start_codon:yes stop_codon:yes gene_type:complete